jgi:hypothetical protein
MISSYVIIARSNAHQLMTSCRLNGKLRKTEIGKCEPTKTGIVYQSRIEAKPAFYPALVQASRSCASASIKLVRNVSAKTAAIFIMAIVIKLSFSVFFE